MHYFQLTQAKILENQANVFTNLSKLSNFLLYNHLKRRLIPSSSRRKHFLFENFCKYFVSNTSVDSTKLVKLLDIFLGIQCVELNPDFFKKLYLGINHCVCLKVFSSSDVLSFFSFVESFGRKSRTVKE